ncbi:hypothetical protein RQ479_32175 (plasmid) [Mesorhizobium sp. ISC25]|uniref:hypothetical protein n=1 Tax=Mesorhizobium sp. ISC25 TaxID=3077335 RepID=UPI0035E25E9D
MVKKPTTNDGFDRARLREAANHLTNGLIEQLHDILKHSAQENLKGAQRCGQTAVNLMQAAAVLRTVHDYADMTSRRLRQIASLMLLGKEAGDKPEYFELCDSEGPGCDCEVVCKHKPKHLLSEGEKTFGDALQRSRQFFQNEPPNG